MGEFVYEDKLRAGVNQRVIKRLESLTNNLPEQFDGLDLTSEGVVKTITDEAVGRLRMHLDTCIDASILQLTQGIRFARKQKGK